MLNGDFQGVPVSEHSALAKRLAGLGDLQREINAAGTGEPNKEAIDRLRASLQARPGVVLFDDSEPGIVVTMAIAILKDQDDFINGRGHYVVETSHP